MREEMHGSGTGTARLLESPEFFRFPFFSRVIPGEKILRYPKT